MSRSRLFSVLGSLSLTLALTACGGGPEYPNCNNDQNCHEGEYCVNGQCQQCRDGSDCAPGQRCAEGRCDDIEGWCGTSTDCPDGEECRNNRCVEAVVQNIEAPPPVEEACSLGNVYFAYDSSELSGSARSTLENNARCIEERSIQSVTLFGMCDPRGTEEYNLALGDQRARSVSAFMQRLGVSRGNLSTRSLGEEQARGSDESSWAQDRRVESRE